MITENLITQYKIPFDKDGNLLREIPHRFYRNPDTVIEYREKFIFYGSLELIDYIRSGHQLTILWKDIVSDSKYPMFFVDFIKLIKASELKKGIIKDYFTFQNRGGYFGIRLINEKERNELNINIAASFDEKFMR